MPRKKVTVYTVREAHWDYNDEFYFREELPQRYEDGDPSAVVAGYQPLKAFLSREKAEVHRLELERERWGSENPFEYGDDEEGLSAYSTSSEEAFLWHLEELGLEPIDLDEGGLWEWWDGNVTRMSKQQRNGVWALLDRVCFFEVVPMQVALEE